MARTNSFSKREVAKRKQRKRKEKQKRREARRKEAPDTFKEMIAYVDENGVITDTPPEPVEEEIALEDIEISVPPKEVEENDGDPTGVVDFYNEQRGFGFIREGDGVIKYFFHRSNADYGIAEGDRVTYRLEQGPKGINAVDVKIINSNQK